MDDLSVSSERSGDILIVRISGRVDSVTAVKLDTKLEKLGHENRNMVFDLKEVSYLSSAGVRSILKASKTAQKTGGNVKLAAVPDLVANSLETAGLLEVFSVYPSVDKAVADF